jgi:hypothetical protein
VYLSGIAPRCQNRHHNGQFDDCPFQIQLPIPALNDIVLNDHASRTILEIIAKAPRTKWTESMEAINYAQSFRVRLVFEYTAGNSIVEEVVRLNENIFYTWRNKETVTASSQDIPGQRNLLSFLHKDTGSILGVRCLGALVIGKRYSGTSIAEFQSFDANILCH